MAGSVPNGRHDLSTDLHGHCSLDANRVALESHDALTAPLAPHRANAPTVTRNRSPFEYESDGTRTPTKRDEPVRCRVVCVSGLAFPEQSTFFVPNFVPEANLT